MVRRVGFNDAAARGSPAPAEPPADVPRDSSGRARTLRFRVPIPRTAQPGKRSPVAVFVIGLLGFVLVGWALGIAFAIANLVGSAEEPLGGDPLAYVMLGLAAVVWLFATRLLGLLVRGIRAAGNQPGPERRRKD